MRSVDIGGWAIRNRAVVLVAVTVAIAAGVVAAWGMPSGIYPEVVFPRVVVVATGGDEPPDVFLGTVVRPLEQELQSVLGVRRVRARTIRGTSQIELQFVPGTDMWRALQMVESRVQTARADLPEGIDIEVERVTATSVPVVSYNLAGRIDPRDLRDIADLTVAPALGRVPGVGRIWVLGGDEREVEIELDPERAAAARQRPQDVAARVRDELAVAAVGRLEQDRQLSTVLVSAEAASLEELRDIPVATANGVPVRLGSMARVYEGAVDRTTRIGGPRGETVSIAVERLEDASTPEVVDAVQNAAHDLAGSLPAGVTLEPVYDQAALVEESIASVRDAILIGIILCVVVLGLSLRDVRAGAIAALAVPATLAITFLVVRLAGETLNVMSLGGMAVAIGLVIDDAIIVIEAIRRRQEHGEDRVSAAVNGTNDLAAAVIGTTITTVIVFVPLAFVPGLVGDFFKALAITLAGAVVLSLVIALVAVPVLATRLLPRRIRERGPSRLDRFYGGVAAWGARRRWVGLILVVAVVALGAVAAARVPTGFLPEMDEGAFVLDVFTPAGTSLEQTDAVARRVEHVLATTPEVSTFTRRTGSELGPITATLVNEGDIIVRLEPPGDRERDTPEVMAGLRRRLANEVPEARTELFQVMQDVLGDLEGNPDPVEIRIYGERYDRLAAYAARVADRIRGVEGLVDFYEGVEEASPTMVMRVDRAAAARIDRTPADVAEELHAMLAGTAAGTVRREDRRIGVRVRYPDAVRFDPARVADLPLVFGDAGGVVPVRAVVRPTRVSVPTVLLHESLQPVVILTAATEDRDLGSVVADVRRQLAGLTLPAGYRLEIGGQFEAQQRTVRDLSMVGSFGLLLTFLVLVAQFRSVRPAIAVVLTTPFAIVGALVTLWATQTPLNASSLMGCVLLLGLEVKTGILLLEVAEEHAAEGHSYVEALSMAAQRRIRPIMLTTTATIFGVLPLAFGLGAGAQIHRPLAVAVLGGLLISKFLNLVALPSLATLLASRRRRHPKPAVSAGPSEPSPALPPAHPPAE